MGGDPMAIIQQTPPRVLFSENDPHLAEAMKISVEHVSHRAVTVLTPSGSRDRDFLELAAAQPWDFSILFANNQFYESGDRSPEGIERNAAGLVRRLVHDFRRPVIVLYTFPDLDTFPATLQESESVEQSGASTWAVIL